MGLYTNFNTPSILMLSQPLTMSSSSSVIALDPERTNSIEVPVELKPNSNRLISISLLKCNIYSPLRPDGVRPASSLI